MPVGQRHRDKVAFGCLDAPHNLCVSLQIQHVFLGGVNYWLPPVIYGNLLPHYRRPAQGQLHFLWQCIQFIRFWSFPEGLISHCEQWLLQRLNALSYNV